MNIEPEKIQEAKERLGDRNADIIVDLLHPEQYDSRRRVCCCMWPDHDDNHPSMSYNPKTYSFHCFSCGRGDIDIIQAYMMAQGCTFIEACKQLFEAADMPYDFGEQGVHTLGRKYQYPKPKYSKTKDRVYDYWSKRCISPATIDYLDIAEDEEGNTLFQYYDLNDVLVNVKVRLSRQFRKGQDHSKIWHLPGADHVDILYNINRINTTQPLIITSGEGDCAACIECGFPNTVSINGGDQNLHWIGECWDWLSHFEEIILIPDNDESGRKFARDVSTRLGEYRVKTVVIPKFHTKENGEKVSVKDVNELLFYEGKEAVRDAIRDAKDAEIPSVVDYADVKKFDMSDVEGFITHFADLDDAVQKFYMGSTTLITGAPGSGKTSFLSTIICQSVEQGFPTFVYSGELSNESLKSWVDFCHAGRFGIAEYDKPYGAGKVYKVRRDAFDAINRTYKGQLFFYKDSIDQKVSNLMSTAESVVRKYGVKTLVFDTASLIAHADFLGLLLSTILFKNVGILAADGCNDMGRTFQHLVHELFVAGRDLAPVRERVAAHRVVSRIAPIPFGGDAVDHNDVITTVNSRFDRLDVGLRTEILKLEIIEVKFVCIVADTTILRVDHRDSAAVLLRHARCHAERGVGLTASTRAS